MITLTQKAADEIKLSSINPETQGLIIRFAVEKTEADFEYLMGFDERNEDDIHLESNGVEYIFAYGQKPALEGMVVDYDQLEAGSDYSFVFMNPNDPNYEPPEDAQAPKK
jgi:Fe-S cluster assembly iron-binding protein IscA